MQKAQDTQHKEILKKGSEDWSDLLLLLDFHWVKDDWRSNSHAVEMPYQYKPSNVALGLHNAKAVRGVCFLADVILHFCVPIRL